MSAKAKKLRNVRTISDRRKFSYTTVIPERRGLLPDRRQWVYSEVIPERRSHYIKKL